MHETRSRSMSRTPVKRKREDSEGNVRSSSKRPRDQSGVRDVTMAKKARKINKMSQRKINLGAKTGESDRRIFVKKPKHLCKHSSAPMFAVHSSPLQLPANVQRAKPTDASRRFVLFFVMFCGINRIRKRRRPFRLRRMLLDQPRRRTRSMAQQQKSITFFFRKKREISDVDENEDVKEVKVDCARRFR